MTRTFFITCVLLLAVLVVLVGCVREIERPGASSSPDESERQFIDGQNMVAQERWEEAITKFTQVLQVNPRHSLAYYYRGRSHLGLDRHSEAIADFTKALELDPQLDSAYYYRGRSHLGLALPPGAGPAL
jgi:tetratricopeptide (TPR) repeat protein